VTRKESHFWEPMLILPVIGLVLIGVAAVYSATVISPSGNSGLFVRHVASIVLGGFGALLLAWLPPRFLEDLSPLLYFLAAVLLLVVLFAGDAHYGARRWLVAGPIRFQPSEPAKLGFILFLGHYLARKRCDLSRIWSLAGALLICALPFLLVLREPDLGTSLGFPFVAMGMLLWAGLSWLVLFLLASPLLTALFSGHYILWIPFLIGSCALLRARRIGWQLVVLFAILQIGIGLQTPRLWNGLEPYQRARISSFLHPEREPAGAGYQVIQSKIAIGSGQVTGKGPGKGSQTGLAFLPRQHTDFIFSVVGEEYGFAGGAVVLMLFGLLMTRGLILARRVRSRFGSVVAAGLVSLILYHAAVNVAMTLGLAPVTGLPLPFLSFGGSFMVSMLAGTGLLLGVTARRNEYQ